MGLVRRHRRRRGCLAIGGISGVGHRRTVPVGGVGGHQGRVQQRRVHPPVDVLAHREVHQVRQPPRFGRLGEGVRGGDRRGGVQRGNRQQHGLGDGVLGTGRPPHHEGVQGGQRRPFRAEGEGDAAGAPEVGLVLVAQLLAARAHLEGGGLPGGEILARGGAVDGAPGGVDLGAGLPFGDRPPVGHPRAAGAQVQLRCGDRGGGGVGHGHPRGQGATGGQGGRRERLQVQHRGGIGCRFRGRCWLWGDPGEGECRRGEGGCGQHRCDRQQCREQRREHGAHGQRGRRHGDTLCADYRRGLAASRRCGS